MQNSADSVVPSSLDLLGQLDEDWRDTVQLHREEVIFVVIILFYFFMKRCPDKDYAQVLQWLLLRFRKRCCATTCMKGFVTSGWTGRELSVVLGIENENCSII